MLAVSGKSDSTPRHLILGKGTVQEVRECEGEIVVLFDKIGKERTLALRVQLEAAKD